jgi:hypothetical protein
MEDEKGKDVVFDIKMNLSNATVGIYAVLFNSGLLDGFNKQEIKILHDVIILNKTFTAIAKNMDTNDVNVGNIFWQALKNLQERINTFSARINFINAMDERYKLLQAENHQLQNQLAMGNKSTYVDTVYLEKTLQSIKILNLNNAANNALKRSRIVTIQQLIMLTEDQLTVVRGISLITINLIKEELAKMDLGLSIHKTIEMDKSTPNFYFIFK